MSIKISVISHMHLLLTHMAVGKQHFFQLKP